MLSPDFQYPNAQGQSTVHTSNMLAIRIAICPVFEFEVHLVGCSYH